MYVRVGMCRKDHWWVQKLSGSQSEAAQQSAHPIRNSEGPNQEFKIHRSRRANSNASDDSYCSSPENWPMPDGNLTKKTCFNRNHPCCVRKRSFFSTAPCCRLKLPFPIRHHRHGWPDTDMSLVGTIKTVVAVTPRPWLLCLEMKVPSIQSFCCSIGSGCMLPGLDFAQLCRSLGQWQDFFRLRK